MALCQIVFFEVKSVFETLLARNAYKLPLFPALVAFVSCQRWMPFVLFSARVADMFVMEWAFVEITEIWKKTILHQHVFYVISAVVHETYIYTLHIFTVSKCVLMRFIICNKFYYKKKINQVSLVLLFIQVWYKKVDVSEEFKRSLRLFVQYFHRDV